MSIVSTVGVAIFHWMNAGIVAGLPNSSLKIKEGVYVAPQFDGVRLKSGRALVIRPYPKASAISVNAKVSKAAVT